MKDFQIMRYLKKFSAYILLLSLLAGGVFYYMVQYRMQSYTASTIIEYTSENAKNGYSPDKKPIDPNEMIGSNIVMQAMENLGIAESGNMDAIRKHIVIEPIIPEEEIMLQEAQIKLGNEYEIHPTRYQVSFTASVSGGKEYARKVLNEILDVYTVYYGENHVNRPGGVNDISDIYGKGYDYIEMMGVIAASLKETRNSLSVKIKADDEFRSYETGYSFTDLYNEFELLRTTEVPKIASRILYNQITKDRDVLLAKYRNSNNDLSIENDASAAEVEKIKGIINSYVQLMRAADNTNVDSDFILDQVHDNYRINALGEPVTIADQTTEYDHLLRGYVENRNKYEENLINIAFQSYIVSVYEGAQQVSTDEQLAAAEADIAALVEKVNRLYQVYNLTNDEYNQYLGAENFAVLTTVGVSEAIPAMRYTVLIVAVFGVLGCLIAVVLGRLEDIIDYYAFTNKVDGLPNRAKCDRYIAGLSKQLLPSQFTCFSFRLLNLREVNEKLGRSQGDQMMRTFSQVLKSVFAPSEDVFLGYNGAGQYLVMVKDMTEAQAAAALNQVSILMAHASDSEAFEIQYMSGWANAQKEGSFLIRKLLAAAMQNMAENKQKAKT